MSGDYYSVLLLYLHQGDGGGGGDGELGHQEACGLPWEECSLRLSSALVFPMNLCKTQVLWTQVKESGLINLKVTSSSKIL